MTQYCHNCGSDLLNTGLTCQRCGSDNLRHYPAGTTPELETVQVTQRDREAAWGYVPRNSIAGQDREGFFAGKYDKEAVSIQDFARHRLAHAAPQQAGYSDAFYELAKLMGIGARAQSPKVVWEREMLPRLILALSAPQQSRTLYT